MSCSRSSGQISEEKSRSQHFLGTVPWHILFSEERGACRTNGSETRRSLSVLLPAMLCLSVCLSPQLSQPANSSCSQPWETHIRPGLLTVLLHSCWDSSQQHGCLIPSRGFLKAQCRKERGESRSEVSQYGRQHGQSLSTYFISMALD